jgi:hypothetical protein
VISLSKNKDLDIIMENTKRITQVSEHKSTNVLVGANIYLSVKEAKAILRNTDLKPVLDKYDGKERESIEQHNIAVAEEARYLLRQIAKAVLYSAEEYVSLLSLAEEFSWPKEELI